MKLSKDSRKLSRLLFTSSFTDGRLDEAKVRGNLAKISQAKPRNFLGVLKDYNRLIRLEMQKRQALIESATQLSRETSKRVVDDLQGKYGADLSTEFKVNPELIGGLRIKVGSDVWDGSVRGNLARLEEQLSHD